MTDVVAEDERAGRDWLLRSARETRRAIPYLLRSAAMSLASWLLFIAVVVVAALQVVWLGLYLLPKVAVVVRRWAGTERRRVSAFTGVPVPEAYRAIDGTLAEQVRTVVVDPTTRRDLMWLFVQSISGLVMGLLSVTLPVSAINAIAIPAYWWLLPEDDPVDAVFPVTSWAGALAMPFFGVVYGAVTLILVPRFARWQSVWATLLLSPPPGARLSARISELTASRAAALEAHGAELRRIERDLHDGTQNRLVGVVMHLGIAERALRRDPESALPLVVRAQDAANDAVAELRSVVRGIYPPVLTERGLDGAAAALAARCAIPTTLEVSGLRRAPAAVESAAYFVVAEALTNVSKHSGAEKAEVRLSTAAGTAGGAPVLVVEVVDDGCGGADEDGGSGLTGVRRRVEAFDGRVTLISPSGGPTQLRAELPCGS